MRIEITSKNFISKDTLKDLLEKKIGKFDKYFRKEAVAKVRLSTVKNNKYTMEVMIVSEDMRVRSEYTSENMYDNLDIVLPKIERQIVKYRKRFDHRIKNEAFDEPSIYASTDKAIASNELYSKDGKIVKVKNFEIAMTTVENAIEEMDLLEHSFYVFKNAETAKVNIVYKRNDGDYGLLDPEY